MPSVLNFILISGSFIVIIRLRLAETHDHETMIESTMESIRGKYDAEKSFSQSNFEALWEVHGSARRNGGVVVLTGGQGSEWGSIWSKKIYEIRQWEVKLTVSISSQSGWLEGDGLAFFCTYDQFRKGSLFGYDRKFGGFAVTIDTRESPNGTKIGFLWDGAELFLGCSVFYASRVDMNLLIRYYMQFVEVFYGDQEFYKECFVQATKLRKPFHLGISAKTGSNSKESHSVKLEGYDLGMEGNEEEREDKGYRDDYNVGKDGRSKDFIPIPAYAILLLGVVGFAVIFSLLIFLC